MPKTWSVELDRAGIGNLLKSGGIPAMTNAAAERIADGARSRMPNDVPDADVVVEQYTTDRGAAVVIVRHPRARGLQAKYGILTRSAQAIGVSVRSG